MLSITSDKRPAHTEVGTKSPAPATGRLGMLGGCRTSGVNLRRASSINCYATLAPLSRAFPSSLACFSTCHFHRQFEHFQSSSVDHGESHTIRARCRCRDAGPCDNRPCHPILPPLIPHPRAPSRNRLPSVAPDKYLGPTNPPESLRREPQVWPSGSHRAESPRDLRPGTLASRQRSPISLSPEPMGPGVSLQARGR